MLFSVQFNGKFYLVRIEIQYIIALNLLTPEVLRM